MINWTDKLINWNQLPGTELKRLIDTWGRSESWIAEYDKKHGYTHTPIAANKVEAKPEVKAAKTITSRALAKKVVVKSSAVAKQKHHGADGEVKFVEHRNLYVGFFGGRVVVTKRTKEQCQEVLRKEYKLEV